MVETTRKLQRKQRKQKRKLTNIISIGLLIIFICGIIVLFIAQYDIDRMLWLYPSPSQSPPQTPSADKNTSYQQQQQQQQQQVVKEVVSSSSSSGSSSGGGARGGGGQHPKLTRNDIIYSDGGKKRHTVQPVVIEEYNLIFWLVAKVATSEFIRFFMKLQNNKRWCEDINIHPNSINKLKYLNDYTLDEATKMMISNQYTKAIFVRNPKSRLLSAFLDKAIQHSYAFIRDKCPIWSNHKILEILEIEEATTAGNSVNSVNSTQKQQQQQQQLLLDYCIDNHKKFDFFLYNITTTCNTNVHWRSIYSFVDEKWWPYIDHIGYMNSDFTQSVEKLFMSIYSNVDNVTAWERVGQNGWWNNNDNNENDDDGNKNSNNKRRNCNNLDMNSSFLQKKDTKHPTNAISKMKEYYIKSPELERFVERQFYDDFNNDYFNFNFNDDDQEENNNILLYPPPPLN